MRTTLALLLLAGCGASTTPGTTTAATDPTLHHHPTGAPLHYLYAPAEETVRIDLAAVRATPVSDVLYPFVADLVARESRLPGEPRRLLDRVSAAAGTWATAADGETHHRYVVRHDATITDARAAIDALAAADGVPLAWMEHQGRPAAAFHADEPDSMAVVLPEDGEAVFARYGEIDAVLTVARDHAARAPDVVLEPLLDFSDGVIAEARGRVSHEWSGLSASDETLSARPAPGGVELRCTWSFVDAGLAAAALPMGRDHLVEMAAGMPDGPRSNIARGWVARAGWTADGTTLRVSITVTWEELRALLVAPLH